MHFSIPDTQEFMCDRTGSNFTVSNKSVTVLVLNLNLKRLTKKFKQCERILVIYWSSNSVVISLIKSFSSSIITIHIFVKSIPFAHIIIGSKISLIKEK